MLLGVLDTCGPAEIIPYEPDMYNNSAGKRYWYPLLWLYTKPYSLRYIAFEQWIHQIPNLYNLYRHPLFSLITDCSL